MICILVLYALYLYRHGFRHRLINNTDRTLDVVFSRFRGFSFIVTLRQKPKEVTRMLSLCLVIQRSMRVTPSGFFLRVIVNEKTLNIKKPTSSVFLYCY